MSAVPTPPESGESATKRMPQSAETLPTAAVADAIVRLGVTATAVTGSLRPVVAGGPFAGRAQPITHLGSVDVLLDAIDGCAEGGVLVVDNGGRRDEACVGDLIALEAHLAGFSGIVIWGLHRDTAELREIGIPVVSLGAHPFGPRRVPPAGAPMRSATIDGVPVAEGDLVVSDDDGVLVVPAAVAGEVERIAREILSIERAQAQRMRQGQSLRHQLGFADYRARQRLEPELTLRRHLLERGDAVEV